MKRPRFFAAACFFLGLAATVWSSTGRMSVQVQEGQLRSGPSFLKPVIATVAYCQPVDVVQQQGDWMEVSTAGGKKGWMHQSALSSKSIVKGTGKSDAKVTASGSEIALAGKGFNADVEARYRTGHRNADYTWVDKMERIVISPRQMISFLKEGGVEPAQGGTR